MKAKPKNKMVPMFGTNFVKGHPKDGPIPKSKGKAAPPAEKPKKVKNTKRRKDGSLRGVPI